jgi:hypothetical protein
MSKRSIFHIFFAAFRHIHVNVNLSDMQQNLIPVSDYERVTDYYT